MHSAQFPRSCLLLNPPNVFFLSDFGLAGSSASPKSSPSPSTSHSPGASEGWWCPVCWHFFACTFRLYGNEQLKNICLVHFLSTYIPRRGRKGGWELVSSGLNHLRLWPNDLFIFSAFSFWKKPLQCQVSQYLRVPACGQVQEVLLWISTTVFGMVCMLWSSSYAICQPNFAE